MSRQTFALPDVGEGLAEAEIVAWRVAVGDQVAVNQVIVEIETAKAAVELPCPYAGTVAELLAAPGQTVAVGAPIIAIGDGAAAEGAAADGAAAAIDGPGSKIGELTTDGRIATLVGYVTAPGAIARRARRPPDPAVPVPPAVPPSAVPPSAVPAVVPPSVVPPSVVPPSVVTGHDRRDGSPGSAQRGRSSTDDDQVAGQRGTAVPLAKPPVRKLARELGIDLHTLTGSGPAGSITRADVRAGSPPGSPPGGPPRRVDGTGVRREPVRGVRKATAAAMVASAFTAPHVTEFLTVDVTAMIELRDRLRATAAYRDVKLSPLVFAAKAVCLAARRTPEVNAHWDEAAREIVYYDRVQLGIAAATPRGLVVPKIRDADTRTLPELAASLAELTQRARAGDTAPGDLVGGTFTITNVGVYGVDTGTPILNPGESAILALGAVKQAPWVVDGALAVRTVCHLALSFDHRVVDGAQGSRFLADVGALLADPGLALTY